MDESTTAPMATTTTEAPNGWSNKPEDMNTDYYWGTNGEGTDVSIRVDYVCLSLCRLSVHSSRALLGSN